MSAPTVARKLDNPHGARCWGVFRGQRPVALNLTEADAKLFAAAQEVRIAGIGVCGRWENGDLAGAVRRLNSALGLPA